MNDTRARFEEIWPVPDGVWFEGDSYRAGWDEAEWRLAADFNLRLDTFTRCQETTFSKEELNLFRQWFNAVEDLSPAYLEKSDCDLCRKVMELMK